ncbi:DUF5658 family protein [Papillibacter cinnamivorans]|uniref:DUF5658 domain-containing protein n=1 Tax=Papillibacter cinnamivorans DSM 12816 TaxID=1122930 RepID=A0A1W1YTB5_9FIRM|nr:DUF5658 family protein [Papillibacter cinnamivorans]SMC39447.1 hypothetical protein SAMN02745168_0645 [Papillibacter cinnamivorans DSM 12816]
MDRYNIYAANNRIQHLIFIFILTITVMDAVCTAAGIRLGVIAEGNPLMAAPMYAAPGITAAAVCAGTAALLALIWRLRRRAPWAGAALLSVLAVKLGVVGLHLYWILAL